MGFLQYRAAHFGQWNLYDNHAVRLVGASAAPTFLQNDVAESSIRSTGAGIRRNRPNPFASAKADLGAEASRS